MNIPLSEIRNNSSVQAFLRGNRIPDYKVQEISQVYETEHEIHISAQVTGSGEHVYRTHVYYREDTKKIIDYMCECPAYEKYSGMCKHCVALALQFTERQLDLQKIMVQDKNKLLREVKTDSALSQLLYRVNVAEKATYLQPQVTGTIEIEPKLKQKWQYTEGQYGWYLNFKIGNAKHMYVLKDVKAFLTAFKCKTSIHYGAKLDFIHDKSAFTPMALRIIEAMARIDAINDRDLVERFRQTYTYGYHRPSYSAKDLLVKDECFALFCHAMLGTSFEVDLDDGEINEWSVVSANPILKFGLKLGNDKHNYVFSLPKIEWNTHNNLLYIQEKNIIYECDEEFSHDMMPICTVADSQKKNLVISNVDMASFCTNILPVLEKHANVSKEDHLEEFVMIEAEIKIYLDQVEEMITCMIKADYGKESYLVKGEIDLTQASRDIGHEQAAYQLVKQYMKENETKSGFTLLLTAEDQVYELLTQGLLTLKNVGEVYVSEALKKLKINESPKVSVGVSIHAGLLDLRLDIGDFPIDELEGVLQQYRRKKKFYRLKNGEFVSLQENSLSVVSELSEVLGSRKGELEKGKLQVPTYRALFVEQLLNKDQQEMVEVKRDKSFKALIREIKSFEDSDYDVPESLEGIMRAYQTTGYRWLRTLEHLGFGGILADDMGLGKSIQMISFLLGKKMESSEHLCSMIVCPASLVYNWENELQKFGGGLSVLVLAGGVTERKEAIATCKNYDVVVTSYDLLKRDLELYQEEKMEFFAVIIDEAQNIKNHLTQAAKAVKEIPAKVRFAMTGTPIENRLSELWSIFDFLMPGLLYSYQKFKKEFETPIVQTDDENIRIRLRRMIKPFIMRRIKEDVLKELPAKNEELIYSKLEGEQKRLYVAHANRLRESLGRKSKEDFNKEKLKILAEMTRLRQICCAPALLYENYKGSSAKMDTCMDLVKNAIEGGHKVLLFSQFTSVFDLLQRRLVQEEIPYYRLDGSTPKQKRIEMVELFNQDETPLFLISLKAGGTGLNLTSASIVIHFDPWWNIAAQNQATDRAHRIGQSKIVTVFKLIAKDTIEERIVKLQEAKRHLSDQIISEGGASMGALTQDDFAALLEEE